MRVYESFETFTDVYSNSFAHSEHPVRLVLAHSVDFSRSGCSLALLLVTQGVASLSERSAAVPTAELLLLEMHSRQMQFASRRTCEDGAAEATHPPAVLQDGEAVLDRQRL